MAELAEIGIAMLIGSASRSWRWSISIGAAGTLRGGLRSAPLSSSLRLFAATRPSLTQRQGYADSHMGGPVCRISFCPIHERLLVGAYCGVTTDPHTKKSGFDDRTSVIGRRFRCAFIQRIQHMADSPNITQTNHQI
jgi:hypothetical protein